MVGDLIYRVASVIFATFLIAFLYGFVLTTMDFIEPNYNPVATGHRAADNIYSLFGTVNHEVKQTADKPETVHSVTVAHKIARPYAVTADLSAILGGKMEIGLSSMIRTAQGHSEPRGESHS